MKDERVRTALNAAAERGTPRGAMVVWRAASSSTEPLGALPPQHRPPSFAFLSVAASLVAIALVLAMAVLQEPPETDLLDAGSGSDGLYPLIELPADWSISGIENALDRPDPGLPPDLSVMIGGNGELLVRSLASGDDEGRLGGQATNPSTPIRVAGYDAQLIERSSLEGFAILVVALDGAATVRFASSGLEMDEFVRLSSQLLDRPAEVPQGFEETYRGPDLSGIRSIAGPQVTIMTRSPEGASLTVALQPGERFDPAAASWVNPLSRTTTVQGTSGLLVSAADGTLFLTWQRPEGRVLLSAAGIPTDDFLQYAESVRIVSGSDLPQIQPADTTATTSPS